MSTTFSKEEKAAMRAAAAEAKAAKEGADLEAACLAAIADMSGTDKELAEILHGLVQKHTTLRPKTWYGMPAYANADGKVFRDDTGNCWPAGMPKFLNRAWPIQIYQEPTMILMIHPSAAFLNANSATASLQ